MRIELSIEEIRLLIKGTVLYESECSFDTIPKLDAICLKLNKAIVTMKKK